MEEDEEKIFYIHPRYTDSLSLQTLVFTGINKDPILLVPVLLPRRVKQFVQEEESIRHLRRAAVPCAPEMSMN